MSNSFLVRVQSAEHGTKRIETKATEKVNEFLEKVRVAFDLTEFSWKIFLSRNKTVSLSPSRSKTLSTYKIHHGDMVYLETEPQHTQMDVDTMSLNSEPGVASETKTKSNSQATSTLEDEVDKILEKEDGRIARSKDEQLCRHGDQGKCFHCVPLEPFDESYLKSHDPPIKFLSFHSYLRKLKSGADKGKFTVLENISCRIKVGCKEHPPWPGGICTKCQPNAVTLNRQPYRHVDYIQFENPMLMERFLNFWRSSGCQRLGIMYGHFEPFKDVPLGIKAVVSAIYEPPQSCTKSSIELLTDPNEDLVDSLAASAGLSRVGWIFTDLVAEDLSKGTVRHFRGNLDSHFLSATECIMAAEFQNKNPSPCKLAVDGHFGSKMVTVVVTGDKNNQIHFEGYQVSNQCMALVRDNCLIPTLDAPELGYIKESSNDQYVPDVFFKEKDSYNNEVTKLARPLPVEYLLVDMPAAFPVEPTFTFHVHDKQNQFIIENRSEIGELQDFNMFSAYMAQFSADELISALSDFHVLLFLSTCDMLPLKDQMATLMNIIRNKDVKLLEEWSKLEEWATVEQLILVYGGSPPVSRQSSFVGPNASPLPPIGSTVQNNISHAASNWTCAHCTFINSSEKTSCDMCSLPL